MTKYFYSSGSEKYGPASIEELKAADIRGDTLIWHQGLEDWKPAKEIEEILNILKLSPPPIPDTSSEAKDEIAKKVAFKDSPIEDNVKVVVKGSGISPFSFKGRIRRSEYTLSFVLYFFIAVILNAILETGGAPILLFIYVPLLWFLWAQGAKRCHDLGHSGWYQIIPFYVLWMMFANGERENNQYGLNPKT